MVRMNCIAETSTLAPHVEAQVYGKSYKESKLKSSLEITINQGILVVKARGRLVYRDEAAALFGEVLRLLPQSQQFVLDLSEVEMIDGGGLGELVILLERARFAGSAMKIANPSKFIRELLDLTNLSSVFEIYPTVEEAVQSCDCELA